MSDEPVIVIVEDDPNIADLVELYLRRDGYRPYQASTGERALQVIAERNPELVLLDVGLPGELDGLDVCRAIGPSPTSRSSSSPLRRGDRPSPRARARCRRLCHQTVFAP